ncbi:MAG TPA: monovalent cation:proton antiporter-2 (CPA2) family protein [Steroidobacteraceae bacterium]|nr:monovalent cation:proton antiporter-2 (CPA2) family protein [Steroidobacteraceae bacterium]
MNLLTEIVLFLAAAVIAVPLFRRFQLSAVLAYLVSGIVIGPWGLKLVTRVENILEIAEFGIVLLLFVIGLELQPSRLMAMRRVVFGLGSAQVVLTTLVFAGIGVAMGFTPVAAAIAGFGLSLSSTPLVLQLLAERDELTSQHGRGAFGILLFQDIAVLPVLALLPLIAGNSSGPMSWRQFALGIGAIFVVVAAGRYVVRPLLRYVAKSRIPEVFTAAALLVVIGTAMLVHAAGLSMALGAFLAGVLLADSEYRHELEADLEPFKGLLLGLLFIAVGMSVNLGLMTSAPLKLLGITAGLMAVKALIVYGVGRFAHYVRARARSLSLAMLAGGEFAFVLFSIARTQGLLSAADAEALVLAVTLSMLLSPLILLIDDRWLGPWLTREEPKPFDRIEPEDNRVVIAGFGRFGQILARILRAKGIRFTALESSQTQVDFVRRFGSRIFYGDASRPELLRSANLERAEVLIIAVDDIEASVRIADFVTRNYPKVKIFARVRNRQDAFRLLDFKIRYIIRETLLSSLDMAEQVLEALGSTRSDAKQAVITFRAHDEAMMRQQYEVKDDQEKLLASARESAQQLEKLFEADAARPSE